MTDKPRPSKGLSIRILIPIKGSGFTGLGHCVSWGPKLNPSSHKRLDPELRGTLELSSIRL